MPPKSSSRAEIWRKGKAPISRRPFGHPARYASISILLIATAGCSHLDSLTRSLGFENTDSQAPEALRRFAPEPREFSFDPAKPFVVEGRNGLAIRIRPGDLDLPEACQQPGSKVDGRLTDYISPLEVVAANVDFLTVSGVRNAQTAMDDSGQGSSDVGFESRDRPVLLESAGMFDLKLYCNGSPVSVAEGKRIAVKKPDTIQGSELGMYKRTSNGWQESPLRRPSAQSVIFRGRVELVPAGPGNSSPGESPNKDPDGVANDDTNDSESESADKSPRITILDAQQHYELESYPPGEFSIRATPGERKNAWFVSPRHRPWYFSYGAPENPGVNRVPPVWLKAFPEPVDADTIVEVQRSDLIEEMKSEKCSAHLTLFHYDTGWPSFGLRVKINGKARDTDRAAGFCISESELTKEGGVTVEFDFGAGYEEQKTLFYTLDKSDKHKAIDLVTNRAVNNNYGESPEQEIVITSDNYDPGFRSYVLLDSVGFWNFDFPRTDLACLNVDVQGMDAAFSGHVLSLDRISAYRLLGENGKLKTAFLQGERSKILVFSLDSKLYGISDEFRVWNKYGHFKLPGSPCQEIGPIVMKPVPDYAKDNPERFKKELGLR